MISEWNHTVTDGLCVCVLTGLNKSDGLMKMVSEGQNFTQGCFQANDSRKFFCKDKCERKEDVLIDTNEDRAQSGRYSLKYTGGSALGLYVNISPVTGSDSGLYTCGYGSPLSLNSKTFRIMVGEFF